MAEENLDITKFSLEEKIMMIKHEIKSLVTTKSGKNIHSNFTYFQLEDFLPIAINLFVKYNIYNCSYIDTELETIEQVTITDEEGKTVTTKTEKPVEYVYIYLKNLDKEDEDDLYRIKTAEATIYGASPIQNLGGKLTYMKRYAYMNLLDLVDPDTVDTGKPQTATNKVVSNVTPYDMPKAAVTNMASTRQQAQSVSQPVPQPVTQPVTQPVPQPVTQPIYEAPVAQTESGVPQGYPTTNVPIENNGTMTLETKTAIAQMLISKNLNPADTIHNIAKQLGTTVEALQESQKDEVIKIINNL